MKFGIVYKVSIGDNFIIGSTINLEKRKNNYISILKNGRWSNSYVQNSFNKYGLNCFKLEVLQDNIPEDILEHVEDIWIGAFCGRAEDDKGGMNMRDAFRTRFGKETREKMSKSKKGKKFKDEIRLKLHDFRSESMSKKFSKEVHKYSLDGFYIESFKSIKQASRTEKDITNIARSARSGGKIKSQGFLWSYVKAEKIEKYSIDPLKNRKRKVNQYSLSGEFIKQWDSFSEINKIMGYSAGSIHTRCNSENNILYGYRWNYA